MNDMPVNPDTHRGYRSADFIRLLPYQVVPTNLAGVFASPPPPDTFDRRTASAAERQLYGMLWRQPLPTDPPAMKATWDRFFGPGAVSVQTIIPQLQPGLRRARAGLSKRSLPTMSTVYNSPNWGGCVATGSWVTVTGSWTVPTVSIPANDGGYTAAWRSSSWVGLDGTTDGGNISAGELLQAGVEQDVDQQGNTTYYAWFEWVTPEPVGFNPAAGTLNSISFGKTTFSVTTPFSPALAGVGSRLYLLWRDGNDDGLGIAVSTDGGKTLGARLPLGQATPVAPALCSDGVTLYMAWKGDGNDFINVAEVAVDANGQPTGLVNQVTLASTTQSTPALAVVGTGVYLAWRGDANNVLCVSYSSDGGNTFANEIVAQELTSAAPSLVAIDGQLFIAWKGDGNDALNVAAVDLTYATGIPTGLSNKVTLSQSSPFGPTLATLKGVMFLAWRGDGKNQINIAASEDNGSTFGNPLISQESSGSAPVMAAAGGTLYTAWSGYGNTEINIAPLQTTGFSEPPYYNEAVITNFPVKPGDFVTVSVSYVSTVGGSIDFFNQATNQHFKLSLPRPPGILMNGGTVEWIMEAINGGYGGNPPDHIPQFTNVVFQSAFGCSAGDKTTANPQSADTYQIQNGAVSMNTVTAGNETLTVAYVPLAAAGG